VPFRQLATNYPTDPDSSKVIQQLGGELTQSWVGSNTCVCERRKPSICASRRIFCSTAPMRRFSSFPLTKEPGTQVNPNIKVEAAVTIFFSASNLRVRIRLLTRISSMCSLLRSPSVCSEPIRACYLKESWATVISLLEWKKN
jgi:hypothetical protein